MQSESDRLTAMFTTMFTRAGEENRTPVSAWEHSPP
jgi:hypothetical protein